MTSKHRVRVQGLALRRRLNLIVYLAMMLAIILFITWILRKLRALVRQQFPVSRAFVQCPCNWQQNDLHSLLHKTTQIVFPLKAWSASE